VPGATVADSAGGGMHAVLSIMAALVRRGTSGEGAYLDVSAAEGVLSLMALAIDQYLATGEVAGPRQTLLTGRYACYDLYEAKDGRWLSVGAIEPHFYANLCKALGCEKWLAHQQDDAVQDEIRADFRAAFKARTRDEWVADLGPNDTCVAPVNSIEEVANDEQFRARGVFVQAEQEERGRFELLGPLLAGGIREPETHRVREATLTDTVDVLRDAGISTEEIETMRSGGIVA
jgi:alpha-methylacyl-CoA racemase